MKRKVAIIGANSYIARNLIYILKQEEQFELSLYDYQSESADHYSNYKAVNICNKQELTKIDFAVDYLFIFTGKTGSKNGFFEYATFLEVNEKALLNVLEEYRLQKSLAKIIFPSTRLVYKGSRNALVEEAKKECKTIYAMNKLACEQYLKMYHQVFDVTYCIFRICVPYGTCIPGVYSYGTIDFMLGAAKKGQNIKLYGEGSARRTFTHIKDICNSMIKASLSQSCVNDIYNIGGEEYHLYDIAEMIAKKYCVEVEYIPWPDLEKRIESGDTVFDDQKLKQLIGEQREMDFKKWITLQQK